MNNGMPPRLGGYEWQAAHEKEAEVYAVRSWALSVGYGFPPNHECRIYMTDIANCLEAVISSIRRITSIEGDAE